jgi:hypothetical protein
LLGLESSMANPDLAAPNAAILPNQRFSCPFAGLQAQLQPVAEIVPNTQPTRSTSSRSLAGRHVLREARPLAVGSWPTVPNPCLPASLRSPLRLIVSVCRDFPSLEASPQSPVPTSQPNLQNCARFRAYPVAVTAEGHSYDTTDSRSSEGAGEFARLPSQPSRDPGLRIFTVGLAVVR